MNLKELLADARTSLQAESVNAAEFAKDLKRLKRFSFWAGAEGEPQLWEHQRAAISTIVAYLNGDKSVPEWPSQKEAALLKLPTGTGKSGVIAVLARCIPKIRRVLILTPRTALTEQLMADIRFRFWQHIGLHVNDSELFVGSADSTGIALENTSIRQLLPSNVAQIVQHLNHDKTGRTIVVGTHQALAKIRNISLALEDPNHDDCINLLKLVAQFDLIIVDEGHYEPAISWSHGVREFNIPTLLLSATPYRNDYKSFCVRGRYVFNMPYQEALDQRIIRPVEIVAARASVADGLHAAVNQFVKMLQQELPHRLREAEKWFRDGVAPKVIVRANDFETLILLQSEVNRVFETRAVVIHDRAKRQVGNEDCFSQVSSAQRARSNAVYWIHQNKLMEGVDDPTFVAVAIFDLMGSARQLVQQIGRATRYSSDAPRLPQTGWVLSSSANAVRILASWEGYQAYEDYARRNAVHFVSNEVALPDRLLEYMAEYQYINGEFRKRFGVEQPLSISDIQLPRTAVVLRSEDPLPDIRVLDSAIKEGIMDKDRFKITPVANMPAGSFGFSYYAWRTSPYLVGRFFSEWKLGIFIAVKQGDLIFMQDTEGLVVDLVALKLKRISRAQMEKTFPSSIQENNSRLSRMSFSSLDMSQHAIRGMAMRTRSFADVFTDLLDPSLVPSTAAGFVNGSARYVGFARSRLRDASERYVSLSDFLQWTSDVAQELNNEEQQPSRVFERYAVVVESVDAQDAQPVSVLLDPSLGSMQGEESDGAAWVLQEGIDYFDLCADVIPGTGEFFVKIGEEDVRCKVEFVPLTRKYRLTSERLNELIRAPEGEDRTQQQTLVQRLNKEQAFRILIRRPGVVYSEGTFYEPRNRWILEDKSKPILDYIHHSPSLGEIISEKGEVFHANKMEWYRKSIFGLFAATCDAKRTVARIDDDELTTAIESIPLWFCDDDGREVADFIGVDTANKKIVLVHAKVGKQDADGQGFNVGGLQDVGRQALASLGFISRGQPSPIWTPQRWETPVQANTVTLTDVSRIFRNPDKLNVEQLNKILSTCCRNPSFNKEVWIVGAKMARKSALEDGLAQVPLTNRLRQFLMHWDSMQTACARANTRLRFFC
ncbi:DEAD/DEAH box helicase [Pseudomonas fragariae (ex Marin et al. 2024)]|uniref:DEAD/DEAH box helicase n=1 Tax=Pseudomonas fragariae (ex Marin et al. 2024) TaxID=3080056 RepID=UPI003F83CC10